MDVSAYLQSARKISLAIVSLGIIALQIGWSERARQERLADFGYLGRVLDIGSQFAEASEFDRIDEKGIKLRAALTPRTLIDASGQCEAQLYEGLPGQDILSPVYSMVGDLRLKRRTEALDRYRYFPVVFEHGCRGGEEDNPALVLLRWSPRPRSAQVSFLLAADRLVRLGFPTGVARNPEHEIDPELQKLLEESGAATTLGRPGVFVTRPVLEALARETAHRELDRYFEDAGKAIEAVINARDATPQLLGFSLAPTVAVLGLPVALLILAVLLLHRLRRLADNGGPYEEPWILVAPRGLIEVVVASGWLLLLLAATGSVAYAAHHFQDSIYASLLSEGTPTKLVHTWVLAGVASFPLVVLLGCIRQLWRMGAWKLSRCTPRCAS